MTYDHQPHVSRVVWKSFGAIADNDRHGLNLNELVNDALMTWLQVNHPAILKHYIDAEDVEKAFRKSLKDSRINTDLQAPPVVKESTP